MLSIDHSGGPCLAHAFRVYSRVAVHYEGPDSGVSWPAILYARDFRMYVLKSAEGFFIVFFIFKPPFADEI